YGVPLDRGPRGRVRYPGVRRSLFLGQRRWLVGAGNATRINLTNAHGVAMGLDVDWLRAIGEGDVNTPRLCGSFRVAPEEGWRRDLRREDGAVFGIVDGDGLVAGVRRVRIRVKK